MARTPKKAPGKELTAWEAKLEAEAQIAADMEANTAGGQFFSTQNGILAWDGAPLPGNEMIVSILDAVFENVCYTGDFDPDDPQGPACFAFGRTEEELVPHEVVQTEGTPISDTCDGCPNNIFGSADRGKGKACRNIRRLALIPAGTIDKHGNINLYENPDDFAKARIGFLKLPVTSIKGYANFVKQVAGTLKRPPYAIYTKVSVVPSKNQFAVVCEAVAKIESAEVLEALTARVEEAKATIEFPYTLAEEEETPKGRKAPAKKAAPKTKTRATGKKKY